MNEENVIVWPSPTYGVRYVSGRIGRDGIWMVVQEADKPEEEIELFGSSDLKEAEDFRDEMQERFGKRTDS